ncbi:MAG: hypothetical protein ABH871_02645 [Pseudomonadota bacterium]
MKKVFSIFAIAVVYLCSHAICAHAKETAIDDTVFNAYTPAIMHYGLISAYENPDPSKLRNFVVLENGGIPAERARFFITWSDYDYRGVVIHLDKEDKITTRRGKPYAYLKRGDVMAVVDYKRFNNTIYLKLLSADVYVPENRKNDKRHARVSVMLGFKFPKDVFKNDDADAVIAKMEEWIKPFPDLQQAMAYATVIGDKPLYIEEAIPKAKVEAEDKRIKNLEDKIEKTRQNLEEAEKELKDIKEEK